MVEAFNRACSTSLDLVAPLKTKRVKNKSYFQTWCNDTNDLLRKGCRKGERKWNKDKLQISFEILRDHLTNDQKAMKAAKSNYLCNLFAVNAVLHPTLMVHFEPSTEVCQNFLKFFTQKIHNIKTSIQSSNLSTIVCSKPSGCFDCFHPVSTSQEGNRR